jgi:hypothetical protein
MPAKKAKKSSKTSGKKSSAKKSTAKKAAKKPAAKKSAAKKSTAKVVGAGKTAGGSKVGVKVASKKTSKKAPKKAAKKAAKKPSATVPTDGAVMAPGILVVNMIPRSRSGETNQDSEPNLAVNPANPQQIVGSAFTPDPGGGPNAPIYFSTDGGNTWKLNSIIPGNGQFGTGDITVRFTTSNTLYAGILRGDVSLRMNILRTANFTSPTPMTVLVSRDNVDQPYIQAARVLVGTAQKDVVFNGDNDFGATGGKTATIDHTTDGQAGSPAFKKTRIDSRTPFGVDAPSIRPTVHPNGTVYGAYLHRLDASGSVRHYDVVVVRDDKFGTSTSPFTALKDPGDNLPGRRIVTNRLVPWLTPGLGQERTGSSLSIAVDPTDSKVVYVAWADRVGTDDYTLHVRVSRDGGANWSNDLLTITNATNPALAVNSAGKIGFLYQQLRGTVAATQRWVTHLRLSTDGISWNDLVLANVPAATPPRQFFPYIGDYNHLLCVGKDFYGIFSANNFPDAANFPNGVRYQRNVNFTTHKLLNVDNTTEVAVSIDPFFFTVAG